MRKWKILSNTLGEIAVLGPKIKPGEKITVIDVASLIELMEICDNHLVQLGEPKAFAQAVRQLQEAAGETDVAG